MAEKEDAKREKWGNVYRDELDIKFDGRRSGKREVALYRPGCGLLPKSPRGELEDMSGSASNFSNSSVGNGKKADLSGEAINGPYNGPGPQHPPRGGRKSGQSGKGRPGRSDRSDRSDRSERSHRSDGRNRDNTKDVPVSKLAERLSQVQKSDVVNQLNNAVDKPHTENSSSKVANSDHSRKTKKPEQAIYVPKPVQAQTIANKEAALKTVVNHHKEEIWTDDDSASFCAEDDSKAGASQSGRDPRNNKRKPKNRNKKKKGNIKKPEGEEGKSQGEYLEIKAGSSQVNNWEDGKSDTSRQPSGYEGKKEVSQQRSGSNLGPGQHRPRHDGGHQRTNNGAGHDSRQGNWNDRSNNWQGQDNKPGRSNPTRSYNDNRKGPPPPGENRRYNNDDASMSQSWHADAQQNSSRNVRLGSEPRSLPPGSVNIDGPRSRDTRSVEPSGWNADKVQAKPPSGRRGSGKDLGPYSSNNSKSQSKSYNAVELPPRFRRLKMAENGMKDAANINSYPKDSSNIPSVLDKIPGKSYIGTNSEEVWDGSTVTFQGSQGSHGGVGYQFQPAPSVPLPLYSQPPPQMYQSYPHDQWSNTVPATHTRGRGRLRQETVEMDRRGPVGRSQHPETPDLHSLSSSVENLSLNSGPHFQNARSQDWSQKQRSSYNSGTAAQSGPSYSSNSRNHHLPSPEPLRRRTSANSIKEENRRPPSPSGRRTPISQSGDIRTTSGPSPRRTESPEPVSESLYVPEITDWSEEVEREERLEEISQHQSTAVVVPESCPDWNEEIEREEQRLKQSSLTDSGKCPDRFDVSCQDWSEEVERSERLEAAAGSETPTRSPSPVSRTDDLSWKKPVAPAQWKRSRRRKKKEKRTGVDGSSGDRHGGRNKDHGQEFSDRPQSRGGSRDHSLERASFWSRRDPSAERGSQERLVSWRHNENRGAPWRKDHSQERQPRDNPDDRLPWRTSGMEQHSGDRVARPRRGSGRDHSQERRRDFSPRHEQHGNRRGGPRDHSHERQRNRRNSGRDHSGDRGRVRRTSGRDHSGDRDRDRDNRDRRNRRGSRERREHSREGTRRERMGLEWRRHHSEGINDDWRRPAPANSSEITKQTQAPGILVLPQEQPPSVPNTPPVQSNPTQRQLYNHTNPDKPIIVVNPSMRGTPMPVSSNGAGDEAMWAAQQSFYQRHDNAIPPLVQHLSPFPAYHAAGSVPSWYNPLSEGYRLCRNPNMIPTIMSADSELQYLCCNNKMLTNWTRIETLRKYLQDCFEFLMLNDLKFFHKQNVDQHLWKLAFYNFIEALRNNMAEGRPNRDDQKNLLLLIIDKGTQFFDKVLNRLQSNYEIRLDDITSGTITPGKLTPQVAAAVIVAQKICLFLGDLARYREQANDTSQYGKARQWYIKAHTLNPKSGKPYNQLAILAVYARRKLDAVYYYMRGLMASSAVVHNAKESLQSLFDENRRKYEAAEKKRREEREAKERSRMLEKENGSNQGIRREVWIHPNGPRVSRTTHNSLRLDHSDCEDQLAKLTSIELNKRFVMSYLHIHGKLFNKAGMETFQEAAIQMLREFYALLQHSPIALNANRFLQLLAINMYAIENTQLQSDEVEYRSAKQEAAVVVSLQMFAILLERCGALLREQINRSSGTSPARADVLVDADVVALLPAIKVWCDWLTCHLHVWNPPPNADDYHVGPPGDTWTRLAVLVNLLDTLDIQRGKLSEKPIEGYVQVRLIEDTTLAGFTPLMSITPEPIYAPKEVDVDLTHVCLRIKRLLSFGQEVLCGLDPPVLKLHKAEDGRSEYISVVERAQTRHPAGTSSPQDSLTDDDRDLDLDMDLEEPEPPPVEDLKPAADATDAEIRALLLRKEELERYRKRQERHRKRVQDILSQSALEVEIEVRPHFIVPDTNCFISYLADLKTLAAGPTFQIMVPTVVSNELEGLQRGGAKPGDNTNEAANSVHSEQVAQSAKEALVFIRQRSPFLRCVTTKGSVLNSTGITTEEDDQSDMKNDDRILTTCMNLSRTSSKDEITPGKPRRLIRDVVLLTEDRNLRVKALSRDVPVRELPDFLRWVNIG